MSASLEQLLRDARIDLILSRIEKNESVIIEVIQSVGSDIRSIKFNSILVLGEIGEKSGGSAVPVIARCLKDDDWSIRREAARSLGKIGRLSETAIIDLCSLLIDEEPTIRLALVSSLGKIGMASTDSITTLKKGLKDKDELVRAEAAKSIGLLGVEAFELIPDLMHGLKDPNWIVRISSAQSISDIGKGTIKAIPALLQALEDKDWRVRYRVVDTLTQIGEPSIPGLLNVLSHKNKVVRKGAAEALGELSITDPKIIKELSIMLKDKKEDVRGKAADSLRSIGKNSIPSLIEALQTSNSKMSVVIISSIGGIGIDASEAIPHLLKYLDKKPKIGVTLARALQILLVVLIGRNYFIRAAAISGIIKKASLAKAKVKVTIARTLGKIGLNSSEAVEGLKQLLYDPIPRVRREAALALGKIAQNAESAVDILIHLLNDKKPDVRWRATEALGNIGLNNPKILSSLQTMIKDKCDYVCESADDAIDKLTEGY